MKILILILLLLPSLAWAVEPIDFSKSQAKMGVHVAGAGVAAATGDSCTGGLLFSWHCENASVTTGTPTGCSAGSTSGSPASGATIDSGLYKDGSNSCDFPTASDYYLFTITDAGNGDGDIIKSSAGTIDFWIYFNTILAYQRIFYVYVDASNFILVRVTSASGQIYAQHIAGGTSVNRETALGGNIQTETWYHVTLRWGSGTCEGTASQTICLCIDEDTGKTGCAKINSALGTWAGNMTELKIGAADTPATDYHMDLIKIYSSWQ